MHPTRRTRMCSRCATLALVASALCAASASAQCGYDAEVMPWPQGYQTVFPADMNELGVIVGHRRVQGGSLLQSAFRWTKEEGYTTLPAPRTGAVEWSAERINEQGTIIGTADLPGQPLLWNEIVRWPDPGRGRDVELLSPGDSTRSYTPETLLEDGSVVGRISNGPQGEVPRPFWWRDGAFLPLPEPLASTHSGFWCAHPSGWAGGGIRQPDRVLGTKDMVVLWPAGGEAQLFDLLPSPQYWSERIVALDRHLHACVVTNEDIPESTSHPTRTFYWNGSTLTPVGPNTGLQFTTGAGLNELGQIVGRTGAVGPGPGFAFLWQNGVTTDLSTLTVLPSNVKLFWGVKPQNNGTIFCQGQDWSSGSTIIGVILRPQTIAEDVNVDCRIDVQDLSLVLEQWGEVGPMTVRRADVNADGLVDAYDLAAVLGSWSATP